MTTNTETMPMKSGLDYVRGDLWKPRMATRKGAQRYADRRAKASGMYGAVGIVIDAGAYWRICVGAQPERPGD